MRYLFATLLLAATSSATAGTLERPERQDTIYVLRGEPRALAEFHAENVAEWEGGELVSIDADDGSYRYWAYSDRTAAQARQFLIPAAFAGFELTIEEYDQEAQNPDLRNLLDKIALDCGEKVDPFFLTPSGKIATTYAAGTDEGLSACLRTGLNENR